MRTEDRHTDMTKLVVAFRNFASASKKLIRLWLAVMVCYNFQRPGSVRNVAYETSLMLFTVQPYSNPPAA